MTASFQTSMEALRQATERLQHRLRVSSHEELTETVLVAHPYTESGLVPAAPDFDAVRTVPAAPFLVWDGVTVASTPAPVATDETVAALWATLRDLVPAEDWLDGGTFKVGDWIVVISDSTSVYQIEVQDVSAMRGYCTCEHCVRRRAMVPVEFARTRGLHLLHGDGTVAHDLARAIALKLALDTDPVGVDEMACG